MPRMPASSRATWPAQSAPAGPPHPHRNDPLPALPLDTESLSKSRPSARKPDTLRCAHAALREAWLGFARGTLRSLGLTFAHPTFGGCISYSHPLEHSNVSAGGGHVPHSHIQRGAGRTVGEVMAHLSGTSSGHFQCIANGSPLIRSINGPKGCPRNSRL